MSEINGTSWQGEPEELFSPTSFILPSVTLNKRRKAPWMEGKTEASIQFVEEAKKYILTCRNIAHLDTIRRGVDLIMEGTWILYSKLPIKTYLKRQAVYPNKNPA